MLKLFYGSTAEGRGDLVNNHKVKGGDCMARGDRLGQKVRGGSGLYLGRPKLCDKNPGERPCLEKLHSPDPCICRNCQAPGIQTEKIKNFVR